MKTPTTATRAAPRSLATHKTAQDPIDVYPKTTPREQQFLFAMYGRELYGLEIIRSIGDCSNGRERITVGTVYPVLNTLEQKGLVHARWGDESDPVRGGARRRYYKLSEAGSAAVQQILDFQRRLLEWQDPPET